MFHNEVNVGRGLVRGFCLFDIVAHKNNISLLTCLFIGSKLKLFIDDKQEATYGRFKIRSCRNKVCRDYLGT